MTAIHADKIDKLSESFRDKVLRKCGRFPEIAEYCFIVPSYSIHRIQEVHATLVHVLWDLIHLALGEEDVI
jgi:D-sedoheptulose 7-phosphate isomerase